ncbi:MAG: carbohydrate ABC transporter permease [Treponema sp.]|nr:carbohydrate ABC transporter permease [Treponema sp.]
MASIYKKNYIDVIILVFMIIVIIITLYPFLNVAAKSLNDPIDTVKGGVHIWPRVPTLQNYIGLFEAGSNLPVAFRNSVLRTVIGAASGVLCCAMFAFVLSRRDFIFRKSFTIFLVITMYVSGGLIPDFLLIRSLGLINTFWVYLLPGLINAFNVIVIRAFMDTLPLSLQESAKIDGANDVTIFFAVILPLCKPVLATIALFIAVGQWNSWFDTYIYARGNTQLSTLQYELMKVLDSAQSVGNAADIYSQNLRTARRSPEAIKMAITVIATVPILLVYPFLQKYFVSGITLGAVKE